MSHGVGSHLSKPLNEPPNDHLPFKPTILDDLPEPQGDWLQDYKKKQLKYWRHFFMGLFAISGTLYFVMSNLRRSFPRLG